MHFRNWQYTLETNVLQCSMLYPLNLLLLCTLSTPCKSLPGEELSTNTTYRATDLGHSSGVGEGKKKGKGKGMSGKEIDNDKEKEEQGQEKCYTARVFYIPQTSTTCSWLMHFTIVRNLELYHKVNLIMYELTLLIYV